MLPLCVYCQGPTHGWCLRPKAPFLREDTATAARMTPPVEVCTFMVATRRCLPTNTALLMTSTAMKLTPGHGKSTNIHMHLTYAAFSYSVCIHVCMCYMPSCHTCPCHAHVPGLFWERAAFLGTCTRLRSSAARCSSLVATRTTTRHSVTGPSASPLTSSLMTSVGLWLFLTSCHCGF